MIDLPTLKKSQSVARHYFQLLRQFCESFHKKKCFLKNCFPGNKNLPFINPHYTFFLFTLTLPPKKDWPNTPRELPNPKHVRGYIVRGSYIITQRRLYNDDRTEIPGAVADLLLRWVTYAAAANLNFLQDFTKTSDEEMEQYTVRERKPSKNKPMAKSPAYAARATMKAQLLHIHRWETNEKSLQ